jgi:hypothetical protein
MMQTPGYFVATPFYKEGLDSATSALRAFAQNDDALIPDS